MGPGLCLCDVGEEGGEKVAPVVLRFANEYTPDFMIEKLAWL